ncbi:MAG: hypothetical protein WC961_07355 [Anaerovoracaceae bacterium]
MGETISEELSFMEWAEKVAERISVVHACRIDRRKMLETDYDVLKALHKVWYEGELPLYKRIPEGADEKYDQGGLFTANLS